MIRSFKNKLVPSHILYANDILILCYGKMSNINALKKIFQEYSMASSQCFNLGKFSIYSGSTTESNLNRIIASIGFNKDSFLFNYLGIPIFKGRVKSSPLSHISDRVMNKISRKGSLVSMEGRLILVKSII